MGNKIVVMALKIFLFKIIVLIIKMNYKVNGSVHQDGINQSSQRVIDVDNKHILDCVVAKYYCNFLVSVLKLQTRIYKLVQYSVKRDYVSTHFFRFITVNPRIILYQVGSFCVWLT